MSDLELQRRKAEIEAEFGPWTAENIPLATGVSTNPERAGPQLLLRRTVQTISDLCAKPWDQLRILDLGSLEGLYSLEFASQGAEILGIEGRETNNAHARFAAEVLDLPTIRFVTDDVRNLSPEKYGQFDVVFCSGILYHLTGKDACNFVDNIAKVCTRLTIIDTHIGLRPDLSIKWRGRTYSGFKYTEHEPGTTPEMKQKNKWASLDNETSFWFTKPSLLNLLRDVGFTSVYEILNPQSFAVFADRFTFAAVTGKEQAVNLSPELASTPGPDWPEHRIINPHPSQTDLWHRLVARLRRAA